MGGRGAVSTQSKETNKMKTEYKDDKTKRLKTNSKYRKQLKKKATKAELIFKKYAESLNYKVMFQKGFVTPFSRIADFYIPKYSLIIEIDGGYHKDIKAKDDFKDLMWLRKRGIRTLRILNDEVFDGSYIEKYKAKLLEIEAMWVM